jgi:hypothetical protein
MGRILFLSAMAYLAYRYIGRSNKKHEEIAANAGNTEVLPAASQPSAALAPAPQTAKLLTKSSAAAEPEPRH